MSESHEELEYYRRIEDFFATMRGTPHSLTPKDMHLLRTWWKEEVPFTAVVAGVTEVFDRRAGDGEPDPVVSLTYCRHAVKKSARRLSEARIGSAHSSPGAGPEGPSSCRDDRSDELDPTLAARLAGLGDALLAAASSINNDRPAVAAVIRSFTQHLEQAAQLPESAVDEHLFSLEIALLDACRRALGQDQIEAIEAKARKAVEAADVSEGDLRRRQRAWIDREIREMLALPRLELEV